VILSEILNPGKILPDSRQKAHPFCKGEPACSRAGRDQICQLRIAQRFTLHREANLEIKERIGAKAAAAGVADDYLYSGPGTFSPPVGKSGDQAARFQFGNALQEQERFLGTPGQGVVDIAALHQFFDPGEAAARLLDRFQEPEKSPPVAAPALSVRAWFRGWCCARAFLPSFGM
jgi:hypothetical protein